MTKSAFLPAVAVMMFAIAPACGSDVSTQGSGGSGSGGVPVLDQDCYDGCIASGRTEEECREGCTTLETGSGANGSGANGAGASGTGGTDPALVERNCFECLEEKASACPTEHAACENDLACKVLKKCPFECLDDEKCVQQCNDIVPDGVPLMTDLIGCMVCDRGPCLADCADSVMFEYCQ